jgi:hypothetical protein
MFWYHVFSSVAILMNCLERSCTYTLLPPPERPWLPE